MRKRAGRERTTNVAPNLGRHDAMDLSRANTDWRRRRRRCTLRESSGRGSHTGPMDRCDCSCPGHLRPRFHQAPPVWGIDCSPRTVNQSSRPTCRTTNSSINTIRLGHSNRRSGTQSRKEAYVATECGSVEWHELHSLYGCCASCTWRSGKTSPPRSIKSRAKGDLDGGTLSNYVWSCQEDRVWS